MKSQQIIDNLFQTVRLGERNRFIDLIQKIDINITNEYGQNLLHEAVVYNQLELMEELIIIGVEIDHRDNNGQTPLHYSGLHLKAQATSLLCEKSANVNIWDNYGNGPLWTAVFNARGRYDVVEIMVAFGADIHHKNNAGRSPLDFALQIKDSQMINILNK
jgi:uncharacterized protein